VWLVFGSNWQTLTPKIISVYTSFLSPRHPKFHIFDFKISCPPFSFPWITRAGVFRAYLLMQCYRVFFFNIFFVLNYFLNVFFLLFYHANITKLILKKLKKHFKNNYYHVKQNRIIKQHTRQYPSYPLYWQMVDYKWIFHELNPRWSYSFRAWRGNKFRPDRGMEQRLHGGGVLEPIVLCSLSATCTDHLNI
jgi:hypothetical protein